MKKLSLLNMLLVATTCMAPLQAGDKKDEKVTFDATLLKKQLPLAVAIFSLQRANAGYDDLIDLNSTSIKKLQAQLYKTYED